MLSCYFIIIISSAYTYPTSLLQKLTGNSEHNDDGSPLVQNELDFSELDIYFKGNLTSSKKNQNYTQTIIPFSKEFSDRNETKPSEKATTLDSTVSSPQTNIDPVSQTNKNKSNETRNPRQKANSATEFSEEKASQEEGSSEEEEGGNMITGLLGAFLGGFSKVFHRTVQTPKWEEVVTNVVKKNPNSSTRMIAEALNSIKPAILGILHDQQISNIQRPDGSIDLEAIIGLLGTLSTQNPDGTYDFSGLRDITRSFLGGGTEGGGSDIGSFVGSLLGALIEGVANPPGPKGAGLLAGKVVSGILPALSVPVPADDEMMVKGRPTKSPPLDSGAFLTGFFKGSLGSGGNGTMAGGRGSKYTLFKLIFSAITGIISSASSLSSKSDWN